MSLRKQFFISIALAMFVSISFLGAMASWHARQSVENEMHGALKGANRFVEAWLASSQNEISKLVRSFDGNRHVRAQFMSAGKIVEQSQLATSPHVPDWFARFLQIPAETDTFKAAGGVLTLTTAPDNEISETWGQLRDGAVMLALFGLLAGGLLHILIARTAAPLKKLAAGFDAVGSGDYAVHVPQEGPREISRLAGAFNRMTKRLEKLETTNRNLNMQMMTIQEEERADLARDLHDEMGPFLFAMRVDAETIDTQAKTQGLSAIAGRARAIGEAVTHIQQHVRSILKQLRPGDIGDVGLAQAIANLATFWQRYHVGVQIHIDVADVADGFGEQIDSTIYRLVQESLTNAVRHGGAQDVSVTITAGDQDIHIHIEDNGAGLPERTEAGLGLRGMQERVTALGGNLTIGNRSQEKGAVIDAVIPQTHQSPVRAGAIA